MVQLQTMINNLESNSQQTEQMKKVNELLKEVKQIMQSGSDSQTENKQRGNLSVFSKRRSQLDESLIEIAGSTLEEINKIFDTKNDSDVAKIDTQYVLKKITDEMLKYNREDLNPLLKRQMDELAENIREEMVQAQYVHWDGSKRELQQQKSLHSIYPKESALSIMLKTEPRRRLHSKKRELGNLLNTPHNESKTLFLNDNSQTVSRSQNTSFSKENLFQWNTFVRESVKILHCFLKTSNLTLNVTVSIFQGLLSTREQYEGIKKVVF